ncbi:hypothetical protein SD77_2478 [Bacillus badius]|uniref:Uncharacterized protein n=1 Tax=Bacillus badius TaxID=1455 RepID=A0ABR5AZ71_BACBA|nr:hypothetical protein SD78_2063 [Bacillus badius]KIL80024.1 hypothetical protein SD77_2478 [Bacillus badius]
MKIKEHVPNISVKEPNPSIGKALLLFYADVLAVHAKEGKRRRSYTLGDSHLSRIYEEKGA